MSRGRSAEAMATIRPLAIAAMRERTAAGLQHARAWRERNRERFDRLEAEGFYPIATSPEWPIREAGR